VSSILNKTKLGSQPSARPATAVEITPEGVLAAALPGKGQPPVYAFQQLAAGAVVPGIGEANVRAPESVTEAIRSVLGQVNPRGRAVTVVVPDSAVRVFMLDFDTLPANAVEAYTVLRFRLRKMLPFDVEHAGLSYQVLTQSKNEVKVLVAVAPGAILAEYEGVVRGAGYEPGAVLPSSLAALATVDSMGAVLMANLTGQYLTTAIANGSDLLLYRTQDLPEDPDLRLAEVRRGISVAAAFYEDKLGARATTLHYAGSYGSGAFSAMLGDPEMTVVRLVERPETGIATTMGNPSVAGICGALAGAR
jgi:type IV pilus assembly protein PilM